MLILNPVVVKAAAPVLTLSVSASLQTVLRGIAVLLVAVMIIMLLIQNIKFGRGGMGGNKMRATTIVVTILVAAMLMDVNLFVVLVNWCLKVVYEVGQWIGGFLSDTSGNSTNNGTVDIK